MTTIRIDLAAYPLDIVLRTCHVFTARCHLFVRAIEDGAAIVEMSDDLTGEFKNALLDNQLRARIADETRTIRELLVAQAFCEADLLDRSEIESDESTDPRGIAG